MNQILRPRRAGLPTRWRQQARLTAALLISSTWFAGAAHAQTFACGLPVGTPVFGLTGDNRLIEYNAPVGPFGVALPHVVASRITSVPNFGLSNDTLVGIDFRPANPDDTMLYGVTDKGDVKIFNAYPGVVNQTLTLNNVVPLGISFQGGLHSGVDFDPQVDALRIVGSNDQNLTIVNFANGNFARATQATLRYAAGDPAAGADPYVTAGAYDNNVPGATRTTFYMLDYARDTLVTIADRNGNGSSNTGGGVLKTIGRLFDESGAAVDVSPAAGLDIFTAIDGRNIALGYSGQRLFCIDLSSVNSDRPVGSTQNVAITNTGFTSGGEALIGIAVPTRAPTAADPAVTVSRFNIGSQTTPRAGDTVFFTVRVRNNGPAVATGLTLLVGVGQQNGDTAISVSPGINFVTGAGFGVSGGPCGLEFGSLNSFRCPIPSLASGQQAEVSLRVLTVRPVSRRRGAFNVTAGVSVEGAVQDLNFANNNATVTVPLTF